jgi:hypothetical protein
LYALGDNTLDSLAADWQRDPRFVTRGLETIKVIVKPKERPAVTAIEILASLRGIRFSKKAAR